MIEEAAVQIEVGKRGREGDGAVEEAFVEEAREVEIE